MISPERWQRYRRESILFVAVWLVLGVGALLLGNLDQSAEARAKAWAMATGAVPLVAFIIGVVGTLYMIARTLHSDSIGFRLAFGACLLSLLTPLQFFAVTYAVVGAREATAGVLVTSTTLAWPGVSVTGIANLGVVLFTDRRIGRK